MPLYSNRMDISTAARSLYSLMSAIARWCPRREEFFIPNSFRE